MLADYTLWVLKHITANAKLSPIYSVRLSQTARRLLRHVFKRTNIPGLC